MLLPPLLAGLAVLCLLLAVAISFGQRGAKASNPLAPRQSSAGAIAQQLTIDLEGVPAPADVRRAQKPLGERQRLLHAHPYFALYEIARQRFGVSSYLVAAVHYQETGFGEAPAALAGRDHWRRHRDAAAGIPRPANYPNRSKRHPSVKDDFDVIMAIAANLATNGARNLGKDSGRALAARHGTGPQGRLASAMVIERARAWRLLGTLPLPGRGELATPVEGVVGGCGYFGCPRPGHLHNGLDFLAPTGTPIHSADAGVVASVQSSGQSGGYGNLVCIQHRPHLATCYAHLSAFAAAVRPGIRVKRGQVIGLVGSTGSSSAPHLHFEVRRGHATCSACAVDPLPMLSGDVPETALPKMVQPTRPVRRARSGPPAVAPAPVSEESRGGIAAQRDQEKAAGPGRRRNRSAGAAPATGGTAPKASTPPRATPAPVPAPADAPAPAAREPAPAPAAPADDAGTGGAAPPEAPAPAPASEPPAANTPPA